MSPRDPASGPGPGPTPNPDRDRRLAHRPRLGYRRADEVGDVMEGFLGSEAARRMKRFQKVVPALREVVPMGLIDKVRPLRLQGAVLTLEISDGVALHELRQHYAHAILAALSAGGTSVSELSWRLKSSTAKPR